MKQAVDVDVVFVVRSMPTLNDAIHREAKIVGMDEVSRVITNGVEGPLPGTILSRCSEELRSLVREADMVISKGGGNFDTLDEEKTLPYNTFFLLMCKCVPYNNLFGTDLYHPILRRGRRQASPQ
jgi:damage-control phosphatase, subfamily I